MRLKSQTLPGWTQGPLAVLVVTVAYYAAGRLGWLLAIPPGYATAVWPPAGVALAAILLCGNRVWPGIVLGSSCLNIATVLDPVAAGSGLGSVAMAITLGLGAAAQAMLGAALIERTTEDPAAFVREEDVILFLIFGGPVSCLVSATLGVTFLVLGGYLAGGSPWFTWCTWWVGDTIGAMLFAPLILVWIVPSATMTRRRQLSVTLPIVVMFALAAAAFAYASHWEEDRLARDFDRRSDGLVHTLQRALDGYVDSLYATRGLFLLNEVDRRAFHEFTARYIARHPGIRALSWASRVKSAERTAFEDAARRDGDAGFEIRERDAAGRFVTAAERSEYLAVRYVEPEDANRDALGFDVSSDPVRLETLTRARELGQPMATPPLPLFDDRRPRAGFLVFFPVYATAVPPPDVDDRWESLRGVVVGVFQITEMMAASLHGVIRDGIDLTAYDGEVEEPSRLLYQTNPTVVPEKRFGIRRPRMVKTTPLAIAGHPWLLVLSVPDAYLIANHSLQAWTVLASGVLFTTLFGAFLLVLTGRTAFVEGVVQERTAELSREAGEHRRAAEALRQNEQLFRTLSTAAPIGIYQTDAQRRCLYTNPRWQEMAGLTLEQSLGDGYRRVIHPDDRARVAEAESAAASSGEPLSVEFRLLTPAGEVRWVRAHASAIRSPDVAGYVGTTADVTESKRAEEALRESEERYRLLAEQSSDFIARHRLDGVLTYASPACRPLLGYEPEEIIGRSYFDLFYPADVDPVREQIRAAAAASGVQTVSYRVRRKDGTYVWLETTLRVLNEPTSHAPNEVVTVSRDVSERKRVERMRQDLVAMLSHDLKNPLTAVLGFAEILHEVASDDPQRDEFLARIESNAQTALSLATNFVDASQIDSGTLEARLEPVFLNEIIEHVLRHQESRARVKQIRLETRLDGSKPMALLDRRLIDRVVANLVTNAIKFSPAKSRVLVETTVNNGLVMVRVQDEGPGIPEDQRSKLFQRFSEMGGRRVDSTGLGLFIVKTLVDAQGGTVGANFPPEGGTVFQVSFPAGGGRR